MADLKPEIVNQLEGELIECPLCRSEEVELKTTENDSLQFFCAIQRTPVFINEPKRLDPDLLPDELTADGEDADLEQQDERPDWLKT